MAYCKLMSIKRGSRKASSAVKATTNYVKDEEKTLLNRTMDYVRNSDKTEKEFFVSAGHCTPETVVEDFMSAKEIYGDEEREISHYHLIQSFSPGEEVTPELVHKLGLELAERICKGRFQYLVTTHLDKAHLHNHIVINGISFTDGKHFLNNKYRVREIRKISDEICKEYGLRTISSKNYLYGDGNRNPHIRGDSRKLLAKSVIDAVIAESVTLFDFSEKLKAQGYTVNLNPNHKYWTIRHKDWERCMRMARIGDDYTNDMITQRIIRSLDGRSDKRAAIDYFINRKNHVVHFKGTKKDFYNGRKISGSRVRFYIMRIRISSKYRHRLRIIDDDPRFKGNIYADRVTEATRFFSRYNIKTDGDIYRIRGELFEKLIKLNSERKSLYNKTYRTDDEKALNQIADRLETVNNKIKELRKEVKISEWIEAENRNYGKIVHRELFLKKDKKQEPKTPEIKG